MIQAMYSGIAGLKAFKSSLDVIGNNIANTDTVAFKAGRVTFKDALSQTLSGATASSDTKGGTNPVQMGLGVVVGAIDTDTTEGSPQSTGRQNDLMIDGEGYFVLGNGNQTVYSRDGAFGLDGANNLVSTSTGLKVLGWTADDTGTVDTGSQVSSSGINIPVGQLSTSKATSKAVLGGNLNNSAAVGDTYDVQIQAYDSLGTVHNVKITYTKAANSASGNPVWDYDITSPDVTGSVGSGSIAFDDKGQSMVESVPVDLTLDTPNGSVQPLSFTLDTSQVSAITGNYTIGSRSNDGLPLGTLESYTIGQDGTISGTFDNGATRTLGKIAIAQFTNPAGLSKQGNNILLETPNSGNAVIGQAGSGGRGTISSGFLEGSNVDLAQEFANMIIAQRGFQANSRVITTSDEVLQYLVSMKQ